MKIEQIIEYIENPPEKDGKSLAGLGKLADFEEDKLKEMIEQLSDKEIINLWEKVETHCIQWNEARISPRGGIGSVARYQLAKLFLDKRLQLTN